VNNGQRGQVLPLFALMIVALFAVAGLAVDISSGYSARQGYRTAADAASLAGAQNLQSGTTRAVSATDRENARRDALRSLVKEFGATGTTGSCDPLNAVVQINDCQLDGTPLRVSVKTPSPTCVTCDKNHAVQVTVSNPTFQLSFARILGIDHWNVASTSVAGLAFAKSYALQTLRPPKANGAIFLINDIEIDGGSVVNVQHGDVGSNANMDYASGVMNIDPDYGMFYFDPFNTGPEWSGPPSPPTQIVETLPALMTDPGYIYPAMRGFNGSSTCTYGPPGIDCAPTFTDARTSTCLAPGPDLPCTNALQDPLGCGAEATYLKTSPYNSFMASQPLDKVYCYKPGIYAPDNSSKALSGGSGDVIVLLPGAYYFKAPNGGLSINGWLVGGYRPSPATGVVLMFDECLNHCTFVGTSAKMIALNAGNKFPPGSGSGAASAAIDWDNKPVQTSGASSPTPPLLMTLMVNKDTDCLVPAPPASQEPPGCDPGTHDKTINIAGGGSLALEGVQYMPTDNVEIHGGSAGYGQVGQIVAYTLFYSGGTHINQQGPAAQGPGTLRLDAACTAPGTPCTP
jgi:Flp pilus assembly protein TadG